METEENINMSLTNGYADFSNREEHPFTFATEYILAPLGTRGSALPKFFKASLKTLKEQLLSPAKQGSYTEADEARAEPLWCSHRLNIKFPIIWDRRKFIHPNRGTDLVNHNTNRKWAPNELRDWFAEHLHLVKPDTKKIR